MKNYNAKIKILAILLSIFYFLTAGSAFAATLSLSPANVSVTQGQTFAMTVALNPQGQASYTVKVELSYPAALLEVQSFTFASSWLPLTQSGYDLIDNANGRLIKTAGYPGGLSGPATFGTVSFRAKSSGSGNVALAANSSAFDANSQNTLTGLPVSAVLTVNAPAATATPVPTLAGTVRTVSPAATASAAPTVAAELTASPTPSPAVGQPAAIGDAVANLLTLGSDKTWVGIIVALLLGVAVYYLLRKIFGKVN